MSLINLTTCLWVVGGNRCIMWVSHRDPLEELMVKLDHLVMNG